MKTVFEYRKHADECRALAKGVPPGDQRDQLLKMAEMWENLAADRMALVRRAEPVLDVDQGQERTAGKPPRR